MTRRILLLLLVLAAALPAAAQVHGGDVTGTVKDQQGAVLPGVTITAQGIDVTTSTTTGGDGAYHFLDLAPGSYKVTASIDGFRTTVRDDVIVDVGRTVDVPFALSLASVAETVTVNAAAPIVNATPVGAAVDFSNDELTNIPTSRDPFAVIRAVPGTLSDRFNTSGAETGQQLLVLAQGTRQQDTSWTLDGVEITDMASPGQSAVYFNFDDFDEIHVATAANDIRQRTGALNIDLSVKRGGNQYHGGVRGYFGDTRGLQASNIPDELLSLAKPVTDSTSDHVTRNSDWGFDFGGPLLRDRAWFYGSYSEQNVGVYRRSTSAVDRTRLKDPNIKINVQATKKDLVNFLWYNGYKIKDNRAPGAAPIELPAATFHQDNEYSSTPLHGLWKIADDRIFNSSLMASAKYAYFNTGIALVPEGGMDAQAGQNVPQSTDYGSFQRQLSARPQHTATLDLHSFFGGLGMSHDLKFGGGFRTVDAYVENKWPGNGILAVYQTTTDLRAKLYREGNGGNRADYLDFYAGDTISRNRFTIDLGVRYDRQWGRADASTSAANPAFPDLVPGIVFPGYDSPFTWNNVSPRAGVLYALDDSGKTTVRAAYTRSAGQLATSTVGYANPASGAGYVAYRWTDLDGDTFVQPNEVDTSSFITSAGVNLKDPSSVTSPNQIDPDLEAPITQSIVSGVERELMPNLGMEATYTYTRTSRLFGNMSNNITPRTGVPLSSYVAGPTLTGTLPDGSSYSVPTSQAVGSIVVAGGLGFIEKTVPGYYVDNNGIELAMVKRLSHRWMARASIAFNNAREHFTDPAGLYDTNGNPTPTAAEPLQDGGQYAPSTTSGSGAYFINAKWQVNLDGMYQAPYGIELAANVFGRQGYPFPIYKNQALGGETLNVLVAPAVDAFRYPDVWDTDARIAKSFKLQTVSIKVMGDVFNVFNANTALLRVGNIGAGNFGVLTQNMTPRLVRFGVTVGF